jgi:hypothetical protein
MSDEFPSGEPYLGSKHRPERSSERREPTASEEELGGCVKMMGCGCFGVVLCIIGALASTVAIAAIGPVKHEQTKGQIQSTPKNGTRDVLLQILK